MREVCSEGQRRYFPYHFYCFFILYVGLDHVDKVLPNVDDSPLG